MRLAAVLSLLFLAGCATAPQEEPPRWHVERIVLAPDASGFISAESGKPFHPWGFNYGHKGRFMEDIWNSHWDALADDFRKTKDLGANVIRVHLQFGKFMSAPNHANPAALRQLTRLLRLAEETGVYLDVTGLACYRPGSTPEWYYVMNERERWDAQSNFWSAVAATCADSSAVLCYDLMNEPVSPGARRETGQWAAGSFGGFDFVQCITLDPGPRQREDVALEWIRLMKGTIRAHDTNALITVGLLPWLPGWGHLSGFVPKKIAPELDFISVHIYPDSKSPGVAMEALRQCAAGKPVVIEETFALSCTWQEEEQFLRDSRQVACGWIGHYDGMALPDFEALEIDREELTRAQAMFRDWQRLFVKLKPEFAP
jgi:hypothetical protein